MVSFSRFNRASAEVCPQAFYLVTDVPDEPERNAARRRGVRLPVHCSTRTSWRDPIADGNPGPLELPSE